MKTENVIIIVLIVAIVLIGGVFLLMNANHFGKNTANVNNTTHKNITATNLTNNNSNIQNEGHDTGAGNPHANSGSSEQSQSSHLFQMIILTRKVVHLKHKPDNPKTLMTQWILINF